MNTGRLCWTTTTPTSENGYGTYSKEMCHIIDAKRTELLDIRPELEKEYNETLKRAYDDYIKSLEREAEKPNMGPSYKDDNLEFRDQLLQHGPPTYKDLVEFRLAMPCNSIAGSNPAIRERHLSTISALSASSLLEGCRLDLELPRLLGYESVRKNSYNWLPYNYVSRNLQSTILRTMAITRDCSNHPTICPTKLDECLFSMLRDICDNRENLRQTYTLVADLKERLQDQDAQREAQETEIEDLKAQLEQQRIQMVEAKADLKERLEVQDALRGVQATEIDYLKERLQVQNVQMTEAQKERRQIFSMLNELSLTGGMVKSQSYNPFDECPLT